MLEPKVTLRRLQIIPIGGNFQTAGGDRNRFITDADCSSLPQQLLDGYFRLCVGALAELLMPQVTRSVDEIQSRPVLVLERVPYDMAAVHRNGVADRHVVHRPADVRDIFLEYELRRVDADHHQSLTFIFVRPRTDVRKRAPPVDAGVGPELNQHDLAAQSRWRQ